MANYFDDTVSVLLNRGDGTFGSRRNHATGDGPTSVAIGDLSGDGEPDLAVTNWESNTVSILRHQYGSTFAPQVTYPVGTNPLPVAIADLNGDTYLDLAVTNWGSNNVSILLNQSNGTFAPHVTYPAGILTTFVTIDDLDGDDDPDLAVTYRVGSDFLAFLNDGDGTFTPSGPYDAGSGDPVCVASDDLNGDGDVDLAVVHRLEFRVAVLSNNGTGTSWQQVQYSLLDGKPEFVAIDDLDRDGDADLVVAVGWPSYSIAVMLNRGDGIFPLAPDVYAIGGLPASVAIGDLNGDEYPDLAVANFWNDNVSVLLNRGNQAPSLGVDSGFSASADDQDLRDNDPGQDWHESREDDAPGEMLLTLDLTDVGGNATKKAKFSANTGDPGGNAYLTQEFRLVQTGGFSVQVDIYVESISDISDPDRAGWILIGDDTDPTRPGANSDDSERFAYLGFFKDGGGRGDTMDLVARDRDDDWTAFTTVATGLNMRQWYTLKLVCAIDRDVADAGNGARYV